MAAVVTVKPAPEVEITLHVCGAAIDDDDVVQITTGTLVKAFVKEIVYDALVPSPTILPAKLLELADNAPGDTLGMEPVQPKLPFPIFILIPPGAAVVPDPTTKDAAVGGAEAGPIVVCCVFKVIPPPLLFCVKVVFPTPSCKKAPGANCSPGTVPLQKFCIFI